VPDSIERSGDDRAQRICGGFGVAAARLALMPRWAGIGYAVSGPLFAMIGFALDNWIQSVAAILMTASAVWMVVALRRDAKQAVLEPRHAV
jgi:hypothetical protein